MVTNTRHNALQGVVKAFMSGLLLAGLLMGMQGVQAKERSYTFKQLGFQEALNIRGVNGRQNVAFSVRNDEVVTQAKLTVSYNHSPSLLPRLSQFNVILNGEVVRSFSIDPKEAGQRLEREVELPAFLLSEFNQLSLELIGHYTEGCEDPAHSSLWLNVSPQSRLSLKTTPLPMPADLANLPQPFFDRRDPSPVNTQFVFANAPTSTTMRAAGVVASWLGGLADYRGTQFEHAVGQLPTDKHAVVLLLGEQSIPGLNLDRLAEGAHIALVPNPANAWYKVLVLAGRTPQQLLQAAEALVMNRINLGGNLVTVGDLQALPPRRPHDAPNWLPGKGPVRFADIKGITKLEVSGQYPEEILIPLNTPPDLFMWKKAGIPLEIKQRYTLRPKVDRSTLNVSFNRQFIQAIPMLSREDELSWVRTIKNNVLGWPTFPVKREVSIPKSQFNTTGQLGLYFHYEKPVGAECQTLPMQNYESAIDPGSTVDISGIPHYIELPDLAAFANGGFPFSRMADLSESAVLLPAQPTAGELRFFLNLMGRVGRVTGLPAYGVEVMLGNPSEGMSQKDLLLIGAGNRLPVYQEWLDWMPVDGMGRLKLQDAQPGRFERLKQWFIREAQADTHNSPIQQDLSAARSGPRTEGLVFGFESPLSAKRSVVAFWANEAAWPLLESALQDPKRIAGLQGAVVTVGETESRSVLSHKTYAVGSLPPLTALQYFFSRSPWLNAFAVVLCALLFAIVMHWVLRNKAQRRLNQPDQIAQAVER